MEDGGEQPGVARWRQVADALRRLIAEDPAMARLPTETELARRFGVNRHTVRRAIDALSREGLLRAERGRGTFVERSAGRLSYPIGPHTRFSENVAAADRAPGGRLIGASREPASVAQAGRLGCRPGASLHRLETLRVADGVALSLGTSWFEAERFPGIVAAYAETGSVTAALAREGVDEYIRRETTVTADRVTGAEADLLGCPVGTMLIVTTGLNVTPGGRPLQVVRSRFVADRVELVFREPEAADTKARRA